MRKHQDLISKMTKEEKAAILSGKGEWDTRQVKRLGIPSIFFSDGPSGVRKQAGAGDHLGLNPSVPATCMPAAATLANSWDTELGEEVGKGLGAEAMAEDVDVLLGPGLNIKRNPLCGRNFEYFSEDPYLAGKMAAALVRGIQSNGVFACAKHFAVNSQEERRMAMNAVVDERTLREIYLTGFEIAVKEGGAKCIMSSYNEVNGIYANENAHLLKEILRDEWGFDGFVVTDWGASNDHALGVKNGSALEMPTPGLDAARELLAAVESGKISQDDIDDRVDELIDAALYLRAQKDRFKASVGASQGKEKLHRENHQLAGRAAAASAVLLKNEDQILPVAPDRKVAVIGDFAFTPRYQGAGSSMVNSTQVDSIVGCLGESSLQVAGTAKGYIRTGGEDDALREEAAELAEKADVVLYFFGLNEQSESEGLDRGHLRIPDNQVRLLEELYKVNENIVGVLSAGSVIEMPWAKYCKAILHGYLAGQAGAGAILDLLTGKVNPSGRLNETILIKYEDTPSAKYYPARERNSEYREGLFVGYRYFDTADVPVLYPFGHGLSYTTFAYDNLKVSGKGVTFTVKNTGSVDGAEVCQLYVSLDGQVVRPAKELKGFVKIFLKAGEEKTVTIAFDEYTFRYWNTNSGQWEVEGGNYRVLIGSTSADIRLRGEIAVAGTDAAPSCLKADLPSYASGKITDVPDAEYEKLLGTSIPDGSWGGDIDINDALCQLYYAKSGIGRLVFKYLDGKIRKAKEKGELPDLNTLFQYNMPFRAIAKMTGGIISMDMAASLVTVVNGHFFKGSGGLISGYFANRSKNRKYEEVLSQQDSQ